MTELTCRQLAVVSDIHGDIRRLRTFEEMTRAIPSENVFVLGDLVLAKRRQDRKSDDENRCIDLIREKGYRAVSGNHDLQDLGDYITPDNIRFIEKLPRSLKLETFLFAHSVPVGDGDKRWIWDIEEAKIALDSLRNIEGVNVAFAGHYHSPNCFYYDRATGRYYQEDRREFSLGDNRIYLINPGSLGLRDSGSFILFDQDKKSVKTETIK